MARRRLRMSMSWWQRSKPPADSAGTAAAEESSRERLRERARRRLLGVRSRRLFLQVGLPWGAALLAGLVSVLYADWSTRASNAFLHMIAGRAWLAFLITPALTVLSLFLTKRWFTGSEGSGIP